MTELKAIDTVLSDIKIRVELKHWGMWEKISQRDRILLETQAEETERLLKPQWIQEGRKEAAEWLQLNTEIAFGIPYINANKLKSKLKEWGLSE